MASLKAMRQTTGAGYRHLVDDLIQDRRRINTARVELEKLLLEHGEVGNRDGVKIIKRLIAVLKG